MHGHSKFDSFGGDKAKSYDRRNQHLTPILGNLHYLIKIVLGDLKPNAKILCVGVGTGTEIIELAEAFPQAVFVAVEPSDSMLEVCRERLKKQDLIDRCELIHGHIHDLPEKDEFDAALCILVLHHTSKDGEEKRGIVTGIAKRLKPTGYFIAATLSYDLSSAKTDDLMEKWKALLRRSGSSEEQIQELPKMMREHLSIQSPSEVEEMLVACGFKMPIAFFQSLIIRAWYTRKKS